MVKSFSCSNKFLLKSEGRLSICRILKLNASFDSSLITYIDQLKEALGNFQTPNTFFPFL